MGVVRRLLKQKGGRERRRSPRVLCRLRCTVLRRGRVQARVLDVSEGGLCLLSPVRFELKQPLVIEIDVPIAGQVRVEAVPWHVRRVKRSSGNRSGWSIGMMLSKADPGFEKLLPTGPDEEGPELSDLLASASGGLVGEALDPEDLMALEEDSLSDAELDDLEMELLPLDELTDLAPLSAQEQAAASAQPEASGGSSLKLFRVRVKAATGPRTRVLTLSAVSAAEAESLARSDLGDEWLVLEVKLA